MKKIFSKRGRTLIFAGVLLLAVGIAVFNICFNGTMSAGEDEEAVALAAAQLNPDLFQIANKGSVVMAKDLPTEPKETAKPSDKTETTAEATTAVPTTQAVSAPTTQRTVPFATAPKVDNPADYQEQWDAGYLIALDTPDPGYSCPQITLTEKDREQLEGLCYSELGIGGFVGAALIAQAVKNAMAFEGYQTVEDVVINCHYEGRTDTGTNEACRQAVRYIFDDNHDAIQHRVLYNYDPAAVESDFHESQRYLLTYMGERFFDKW